VDDDEEQVDIAALPRRHRAGAPPPIMPISRTADIAFQPATSSAPTTSTPAVGSQTSNATLPQALPSSQQGWNSLLSILLWSLRARRYSFAMVIIQHQLLQQQARHPFQHQVIISRCWIQGLDSCVNGM